MTIARQAQQVAPEAPQPAEQFDDMAQQWHADTMGMWVFLATELLMFSAVFMAFAVNRYLYPATFAHAASHLDLTLGAINMAVLLTGGLTMRLAELAAGERRRRLSLGLLFLTMASGLVFLVMQGYSYWQEYREGLMPLFWLPFRYDGPSPEQAQLFFNLYYVLTGMHIIHVVVGVAVLLIVTAVGCRRDNPDSWVRQVEITGLFWGFVVILNVFVFTALYLLRA